MDYGVIEDVEDLSFVRFVAQGKGWKQLFILLMDPRPRSFWLRGPALYPITTSTVCVLPSPKEGTDAPAGRTFPSTLRDFTPLFTPAGFLTVMA